MRQIELSQNKVAIVDDDVYDYLCRWKWNAFFTKGKWYSSRIRRKAEPAGPRSILMHRVVCEYYNIEIPNLIDHKDGDGLNNTKDNLRAATAFQNNQNVPKRIKQLNNKPTSKYKGVTYRKREKRWVAAIDCNKIRYHIGIFDSEHVAALAYNRKAIELFGEYVWLNIVDPNMELNDTDRVV